MLLYKNFYSIEENTSIITTLRFIYKLLSLVSIKSRILLQYISKLKLLLMIDNNQFNNLFSFLCIIKIIYIYIFMNTFILKLKRERQLRHLKYF